MKWFFCWSDQTDFPAYNWKDLIRSTVYSALTNTSLDPHFIFDGVPCELTAELERVGVKVIYHKTSFNDDITNHAPSDVHYQRVASAAFLRFDILQFCDNYDEFVLYTDADVIFFDDDLCKGYRPQLIGAAPEMARATKVDLNSGVMLINVKTMRDIWVNFRNFIKENLGLGLDQNIIRAFFGKNYLLLPDTFNWKPYWGVRADISLLHWHGPKPHTVSKYFDGDESWVDDTYKLLINTDVSGYKHFLEKHFDNVARWHDILRDEQILLELKSRNSEKEYKIHSSLGNFSKKKLGIAVTTFNRPDLLRNAISNIREKTHMDYELIVCDDGSDVETVDFLRESGIKYIRGKNKGVAWNKNRGIFLLKEIFECENIILLDDDIVVESFGWEAEWLEAIKRYGHICHCFLPSDDSVLAGDGSADNPFITTLIQGASIGIGSNTVSWVGYMDTRFGKYGHEHSDYSLRMRRCGHGGLMRVRSGQLIDQYLLAIRGGVITDAAAISHRPDDMAESDSFFARSHAEPIYRLPWQNDEQLFEFRSEVVDFCAREQIDFPKCNNIFEEQFYFATNPDVMAAGLDGWDHFVNFGLREGRHFGLRPNRQASPHVAACSNDGAFFLGKEHSVSLVRSGADAELVFDLVEQLALGAFSFRCKKKCWDDFGGQLNFNFETAIGASDWYRVASGVALRVSANDAEASEAVVLNIPAPARYVKIRIPFDMVQGFLGVFLTSYEIPEIFVGAFA